MQRESTETALREWRYGQTQAERLCAALLHLESYEDVDPQHPLGGPDGLKDVSCRRDGKLWVAAAFFPPTTQDFHEIEAKFDHDLGGVARNHAAGFAFILNQPLTVSQRDALLKRAAGIAVEIYHLERIRGLLDAPKGCGVRLEYLRIPMTEEEQWAFWSAMNADVIRRLLEDESRRAEALSQLHEKLDLLIARTTAFVADLHASPSSVNAPRVELEAVEAPTAFISMSVLCWLHRVVTEGLGVVDSSRGVFRAVQVWIGGPGSSPETARHVPPPPGQLISATQDWITWWRRRHIELRGAQREDIIFGLAEFHHGLLRIHPFLDANGRLARVLLDQAARELLNQRIGPDFTADPAAYFEALGAADRGDLSLLRDRISAALE